MAPPPATAEYEAALTGMPDPISEVMKLLQEHQLPTSAEQSILEEQYDQAGTSGPHGCTLRLKRSAECLGVSSGHKSKKLAKKIAYHLAYKNERLHLAVKEEAALYAPRRVAPPQPVVPSPPIPMPSPAAGSPHIASPAIEISSSQHEICQILGEHDNPGFQRKLAKLMTQSGQADVELVALAQRSLEMWSSQGGHSAGRRFHDEIKAMCEAKPTVASSS